MLGPTTDRFVRAARPIPPVTPCAGSFPIADRPTSVNAMSDHAAGPSVTISDTYTGDLSGSGTPQRTAAGAARIVKASVGPMDNNAYLITDSGTGESLLIDAANDAETLLAITAGSPPATIVTTHSHPDHWQALGRVAEATGAVTAANPLDAEPLPVTPDRLLEDGDTVTVGDIPLEVIHLRGHTPGSIALVLSEGDGPTHIFTGDSLFPGGVGKTWSPENFTQLLDDVTTRIFERFPDETIIHPGHGADTTLGAERPHLGEWRERGW